MIRAFTLALLLAVTTTCAIACSDSDDNSASTSNAAADTGGNADVGTDTTADTSEATSTITEIVSFLVTENPDNVLSAEVEVVTNMPTQLAVAAVSDANPDQAWWSARSDTLATRHTFFALGFTPETAFTFTATLDDGGAAKTVSFVTGALPSDFPPLDVRVSEPSQMAPGLTLFNLFRWNPGVDSEWGMLVILNAKGEVVWYYKANYRVQDVRLLDDGTLLVEIPLSKGQIIDMRGEVLASWDAAEIGIDSIHHELYPLPGGNIATLGSELREIGPYTSDEGEMVNYQVVADTIVEFTRDGTLVSEVSLFDILDPFNQRPGFQGGFWNNRYSEEAPDGTKDWTHGNALIYDQSDDTWIVSLRHQDALIKMSRATGELVWTFGVEGDFAMEGDGLYPFHQHAPQLTAPNRLMIYDNGDFREGLEEGEAVFTRAAEFQLDLSGDGWTATQLWEYRSDEVYRGLILGDADLLGDTVLITDGGLVVDETMSVQAADNQKWARLREVTYTDTPEIVFELNIRDNLSEDPVGYSVYRAERIPALPTVAVP